MGRKAGAKQVPEERKETIVEMYAVGVKQKDICECYEMPKSTVCNIVGRGRMNTTDSNIENRGLKPKLTKRSIRSLLSYNTTNRFKPLHTIVAEYNQFAPLSVSLNTVKRYLHKYGLKNYIAASKPFLSTKNIRSRIRWACKHDK